MLKDKFEFDTTQSRSVTNLQSLESGPSWSDQVAFTVGVDHNAVGLWGGN